MSPVVRCFPALLFIGCSLPSGIQEDIDDLNSILGNEEMPPSEVVLTIAPADGAMALRGSLEFQITMPAGTEGTLPSVTISDGDDVWSATCEADGPERAKCVGVESLPYETDYDVTIEFDDDSQSALGLTTRTPQPGRAFRLGIESEVLMFGSGDSALHTLQTLFTSADMVGVFSNYDEGEDNTLFFAGPSSQNDVQTTLVEPPGLTFVLPVTFDTDGGFDSEPTPAFFPFSIDDSMLHVPVLDARVQGQLYEDRLEYTLSGAFPGTSIAEIGEVLEFELLSSMVEYDLDSNDDGLEDAATFEIQGISYDVELNAWALGEGQSDTGQ